MIRVYGAQNGALPSLAIGGRCPHCLENSRYVLTSAAIAAPLKQHEARELYASYICSGCSRAIPVYWVITGWHGDYPNVIVPEEVLRVVAEYDFGHVPERVKIAIKEALDCLSVNAFNGFAAVVRRAIQAMCEDLGAQGSNKIQHQINDVHAQGMIDDNQKNLAEQIMLTGHDGAHPHLPNVDSGRAQLLLELLRDITTQIYTRPGRIKQNAEMRKQASNKS